MIIIDESLEHIEDLQETIKSGYNDDALLWLVPEKGTYIIFTDDIGSVKDLPKLFHPEIKNVDLLRAIRDAFVRFRDDWYLVEGSEEELISLFKK